MNTIDKINALSKACYDAFDTTNDRFSFDLTPGKAPQHIETIRWQIMAMRIDRTRNSGIRLLDRVDFTYEHTLDKQKYDATAFLAGRDMFIRILARSNFFISGTTPVTVEENPARLSVTINTIER